VVRDGIAAGIDVYGTDLARREDLHTDPRYLELLGDRIREVDGGTIPFPDRWFDLVTANQVFEHVDDPDGALDEIVRVLRPSGRLLALFPSKHVVREGHLGIPFVHWFGPGPLRTTYTRSMRRLGLGVDGWGGGTLDPDAWTSTTLSWLDERTIYRSRREALRPFRERFARLDFIEDDYVRFRLGRRGGLLDLPTSRPVARLAMELLSGMVFVATLDDPAVRAPTSG
jgi:SAM-dependent methyltransferase